MSIQINANLLTESAHQMTTQLNAAARIRAQVRAASSPLMDAAALVEGLGIKLHPMGAGSAFMSQGLFGTADTAKVKKLRRALSSKGWKAAKPPSSKARTDGVWIADLSVFIHGGTLAYVFVSKANAEGNSDVLVVPRTVKARVTSGAHDPAIRAFKAELAPLCKTYWQSIPIGKICDIARSCKLELVDESGEPWEGILTGRDGRCDIEIADAESLDSTGQYLHLQWSKMPSGRYEINAYIN